MVQIKLLDTPPFYYHEYCKNLKPLMDEFSDCKQYARDEDGCLIFEQPDESWCLPFEPAYIVTDEPWLIKRIRDYAKNAFEMIDIICDKEGFFSCAIPQERIDLCVPPDSRKHQNKPAIINKKIKYYNCRVYSDGSVSYDYDD